MSRYTNTRRFTNVHMNNSYVVKSTFRDPVTLHAAREIGRKESDENRRYLGVLNVDITQDEIKRLLRGTTS